MTSSINYKYSLFKQADLTSINDKTTLKMLHKLQNDMKANTKPVYSTLVGGAHGHLGLVLTDAQYALILTTPFIYLTCLGTLITPDGTTADAISNMRIIHS